MAGRGSPANGVRRPQGTQVLAAYSVLRAFA